MPLFPPSLASSVMMVRRHCCSLPLTEVDEHLCLEEDIGDQDADICNDDSNAGPDYVSDQLEDAAVEHHISPHPAADNPVPCRECYTPYTMQPWPDMRTRKVESPSCLQSGN